MAKEIRILFVEDSLPDAVMVNHELRRGGLAFCTTRVDSREKYVHELEHNPPDVILSDHGLPSFDGFTALAIARARCPHVPFIFVTDSMGEELAIETFENGATDYVLKSRLSKLLPAVQRALREADERARLRQQAEALRQSEAVKSAILDTALDAIVSIDHNGLVQEWNPAAQRILGYRRDEALGRPVDDLIVPPALRTVYGDGLTSYLINGAGSLLNRPLELTLRRADGNEFRAELAITRIPTEEPPRCTALIRDITERKRAEAALRESEERFRRMVEDVKDYAIYMLDTAGRVATWNAGAERTEGYRADEIIGKPFAIFFTAADVKRGVPALALKQAAAEGQAFNEGWRLRKDGSRFWSQGIITALRDESGRLRGFSKVARDVTRQREAELEVRRLNEQLEQRVRERTAQLEAASQELEAFSSSVSHDLRAPLRHICGYVEILLSETDGRADQTRRHLNHIAAAARQMDGLIEALLAFSRMGRAEMLRTRVSMMTLVEEARRVLQREAEGRRIDWEILQLPVVQGDPVMLRQVLINLLSNALKYTRTRTRPQIKVGVIEGEGETVFFVRDNGVGFEMRYADKLFGVFQRLHPPGQFEGSGIGLASVRRIIQRHGGRTWAEGAVDHGSTFYFSLPAAAEANPGSEA